MGDPPAQPFHLTARDHGVLATKDEDYVLLTWDHIKEVIASADYEGLTRQPSQLRAYMAWSSQVREEYGSTTNFLLQKRLRWTPLTSVDEDPALRFAMKNPVPFAARSDYRILLNDWPYGNEPGITHICVWLKTPLPVDSVKGALTAEGTAMVNAFIKNEIEQPLKVEDQDKVLWFKNYTSLQSIRTIDHVHVLIRGLDLSKIDKILEKP
ncbi:hypothetical protein BT63DRAFT_397835 [Microthyrium microscopicum]|uniref:N-acetylglucosamine-induced protein 1 n=1 Tax=Microthyrium microscopicum TaxID=703497 RepID=A0A6A6UNT4_9PEZI|nr:hypothetical protein BT63DRAFT_397835 [Microthyrium microscopicum]